MLVVDLLMGFYRPLLILSHLFVDRRPVWICSVTSLTCANPLAVALSQNLAVACNQSQLTFFQQIFGNESSNQCVEEKSSKYWSRFVLFTCNFFWEKKQLSCSYYISLGCAFWTLFRCMRFSVKLEWGTYCIGLMFFSIPWSIDTRNLIVIFIMYRHSPFHES